MTVLQRCIRKTADLCRLDFPCKLDQAVRYRYLILKHPTRQGSSKVRLFSDVTSRGRPYLGPCVSFPDVFLRPGVRRTSFVRPSRTRRREDVFSTSATNKDVRKTYAWAQIRSSSRRPMTSCRVGRSLDHQFYTFPDIEKCYENVRKAGDIKSTLEFYVFIIESTTATAKFVMNIKHKERRHYVNYMRLDI